MIPKYLKLRPADVMITHHDGAPYLHRWHIIPKNRLFNVYLHKFLSSDDDRADHDHPWHSVSILLKGDLLEHVTNYCNGWWMSTTFRRPRRFIPVFREATTAHRIELTRGPAWTLFITGPKIREWGFYCPNGWRPWHTFVERTREGNTVGRGCD